MRIIHHLSIDLARQLPVPPVGAVQGDANVRAVEISLLENGGAWEVPEGVTAAVAFRKPDMTRGLYDTLPDKTKAVTIDGSTVTAILAPQALSCVGEVSAAVVFHDSNLNQLATFPFAIRVANNPAAGQQVSNDYYRYSTMEEVSAAVEAALAAMEDSKQDFLAKAEEALQVVHDTAAEDAPAIICEAFGAVITAEDAANRPLSGLSLYGKTTQDGTPTPENPVPLESVGAGGSISVTVGEQTLTASTVGGLPGIPVSSGGNYTDENGQQWMCDEIDFARGVYVKRIKKYEITNPKTAMLINYKESNTYFQFNLPLNTTTGSVQCLSQWAPCTVDVVYGNALGCYIAGRNLFAMGIPKSLFADYGAVAGDSASYEAAYVAWVNELKAAGTPLGFLYVLASPIETPLSAEELAAYAALHSNKPITTVFNDGGAGMKLSYVADTKTYIDNKFAAISAAMLNA